MTRQNETGSQTYYPEQKLTIDEALAACTWASAYAEFAEEEKGTLEPGMLADFVVLDCDLTRVPPREILGTRACCARSWEGIRCLRMQIEGSDYTFALKRFQSFRVEGFRSNCKRSCGARRRI